MYTEFPEAKQALAIRHALTIRYIQNDLQIFKSHEHKVGSNAPYKLPDDPNHHLLVIVGDIAVPDTFISNSERINTLPVTGLNVLTILNHEKLAIHVDFLRTIENRLLSWEKRYPFGNEHDFGDSERHSFYKDSQHVEAFIKRGKNDVEFSQIEQEGPNKSYKQQHDAEPFYNQKQLNRRKFYEGQ